MPHVSGVIGDMLDSMATAEVGRPMVWRVGKEGINL